MFIVVKKDYLNSAPPTFLSISEPSLILGRQETYDRVRTSAVSLLPSAIKVQIYLQTNKRKCTSRQCSRSKR